MNRAQTILVVCFLLFAPFLRAQNPPGQFVNFESAPVHPVDLSPDGALLAVCNVADARVELFDLTGPAPVLAASIPVGLDPVTARFRTKDELWVVNQISDSINVISIPKLQVIAVIPTRDAPADLVFAGNPQRAYVSCPPEDLLLTIDPASFTTTGVIPIHADRPKALAVSPDGTRVYAAILESGNGTTILAPRQTPLGHLTPAGPVELDIGPYGGINPPPNAGTNFFPEINPEIPSSNTPPRVSLIVRKGPDNRWRDDNNADWTEFVSGTNAPFSGRVPGWDLLDRDIAIVDTSSGNVTYAERLMNICMALAVNPSSGKIALVGTDGLNHLRFEPLLQSIFLRVNLALVEPVSRNATVKDLNPHLDYTQRSIPMAERRKSLGDPRTAAWNSDGTLLYVAGMGSDNLVVFDPEGNRVAGPVQVESGPVGIALDEPRSRIYLLNRFAAKLTVLEMKSLDVLQTVPLFDPTPLQVRKGRRHFYNTTETSGLGQAACASCHVDGRFDRLAWDLGTPLGAMKAITTANRNFGGVFPVSTNNYHPMKGPMVTQTLQDIIGHEPFHWRGDRDGIEEFNPTFKELQGADDELTPVEMQEFEDFLATMHFPPNRFRNFDNTLPSNLPLPGHTALGRAALFRDEQLPNGNANTGLLLFRASALTCTQCHSLPSGMGPDKVFQNGRWNPIPPGPNGEHHVALASVERSHELPFKVPHLRNLSEKIGLNFRGTSRGGFGFMHDGRVDTLTRFLQDGFPLRDDQQTADVIAFLLAFSGSDFTSFGTDFTPSIAPGAFSRDVPAAVGAQILVTGDTVDLTRFIARAQSSTGRVDLIVKARVDGAIRGWFYERSSQSFKPDSSGANVNRAALLSKASTSSPFLFTLVPLGTGKRLAIDRDDDGALDFEELQAGTNAADQRSAPPPPLSAQIHYSGGQLILRWNGAPPARYQILTKHSLTDPIWLPLNPELMEPPTEAAEFSLPVLDGSTQRYFTIQQLP